MINFYIEHASTSIQMYFSKHLSDATRVAAADSLTGHYTMHSLATNLNEGQHSPYHLQ